MNKKFLSLMTLAFMTFANNVFAITAPTDPNAFGYLFYDYVVLRGLQGSIGFVAGLCIVIFGATLLPQGKYIPALITIVSGGLILGADSIVTGFGMMI